MRRTQVLGRFGRLVHCRTGKIKTVKDCDLLKYGGYLSRNLPERCMFTSSQKLFHTSSKQQDLRRFLEEVSAGHESLIVNTNFRDENVQLLYN